MPRWSRFVHARPICPDSLSGNPLISGPSHNGNRALPTAARPVEPDRIIRKVPQPCTRMIWSRRNAPTGRCRQNHSSRRRGLIRRKGANRYYCANVTSFPAKCLSAQKKSPEGRGLKLASFRIRLASESSNILSRSCRFATPHVSKSKSRSPRLGLLGAPARRLGGQIQSNKAEDTRLAEAMKHVEAVIKLFDPDYSVSGLISVR